MNIQELTDIKTTINWLLENGDFKDTETSYNIAMNSIGIIEKAINFIPCCTELKPKQECYKSGEPCEYDCGGLCKESC